MRKNSQKLHFYCASILNPQSDTECEFYPKGMLVVNQAGIIEDLLPYAFGLKKYKAIMHSKNTTDFGDSVILPGFIDLHFHWVQDRVREMPKDSLLDWLKNYTFPAEIKFKDKTYSKKEAKKFFNRLIRAGTLGGACYSSIHEHALHDAMKEVRGHFVIGNVLMNMNSPSELTQSPEASLRLARKLIKKYGARYAFTPRFAISTDPKVMKEGSRLADQAKAFKQTHLSETTEEIQFVKKLYRSMPGFENIKSYTEIYQKSGMLGPRSLMGHGIHLSTAELKILKKTKTNLVHCPTSNAPIEEKGLGSGLFDFRKVEKAGVSWALGSDIGGGPFLSMLDVMRSFVIQNRRKKIKEASYVKALFRATLAGAQILGLKKCGNLDAKKMANFLVLPHSDHATNAESLLEVLLRDAHREQFDSLPKAVYFLGKKQ